MNPWKIATAGIALTAVTGAASGLGTAYFMRNAERTEVVTEAPAFTESRPVARVAPAARPAPARAQAAVLRPHASEPAASVRTDEPVDRVVTEPVREPVSTAPVRTASQSAVRPVAASAAEDCTTGGERAWRIAKPGLIGAVLGAGLGAAGGAIANGGQAAGKGALLGGLAGTALGAGYGAYKTNQECGTIFGNSTGNGFAGGPIAGGDRDVTDTSADRDVPTQASLRAKERRAARANQGGIQVYNAR